MSAIIEKCDLEQALLYLRFGPVPLPRITSFSLMSFPSMAVALETLLDRLLLVSIAILQL